MCLQSVCVITKINNEVNDTCNVVVEVSTSGLENCAMSLKIERTRLVKYSFANRL